MAVRIPGIDLQEYYGQLGPIQPLVEDDRVTEVMVNGIDHIYVEMAGKLVLTNLKFQDEDQLLNVIQFIVRSVGRRIDERVPLADARLAVDGVPARWVVAVPLHPSRRRRRGYNQSELLAAEVRRALGLAAPPGRLVRVRDTRPQVGLDRLRRRENVADAFRWEGPNGRREPVLLVDDVVTTGATLEACAAALDAAGFGRVSGITLARVSL